VAEPIRQIAVVGGGPAGLFAAEHLACQGHAVAVFEKMPTLGRKFLMAGRGGLNLTHSEPLEYFRERYREAADWLWPMIEAFPPEQMRAWCEGLGVECFIGSSGRVFPKVMKASPLLRAWRARLEEAGVMFRTRHEWIGWSDNGDLRFETADGVIEHKSDAVLLALGGASWPRLGADASWADLLVGRGVAMAPFQASNCGVEIEWSALFQDRFAGSPLKTIALSVAGEAVRGEAMIAQYGLEGGAVYALSAPIREALAQGEAVMHVDLRPNHDLSSIAGRIAKARKGQSLSNTLRKAGLSPAGIALLRETGRALPREPQALAELIKAVPLRVKAQRGLERAISSAGGIGRDAVDADLMLQALPGVFVAGEMLDWDAPTGGYLLQACFATGLAAAKGVERRLSAVNH
jgi:uncharacterized flavoprotein (TIGR03862 family)